MNPIPTQPIPTQPVPMQVVQPVPGQPMPVPTQPIPMQVVQPVPGQPMPVPTQPIPPAPMPPVPGQPLAPIPGQPMPMPMPMPMPPVAPMSATSFEQHLKVLETFGGLYIKQKAEVLEIVTGFETENEYSVYLTGTDCVRGTDQKPYFKAKEESDCCQRQCCGNLRAFNMDICGPDGQPVIHIERPFKCPMIFCNLPELHIMDAQGNKIGRVLSIFDCCADKFTIYDKDDMPVLSIHGDCCQLGKICPMPCGPCAEVHFDIINVATGSTGYIRKIFSGIAKEMFTDADSFILSFPPDANVHHKMLLLGAVFLIDFMYFENNDRDNNNNSSIFD